jgi:hypothetical protein
MGYAALLSFGSGKLVDIELGGAVASDDAALLREITRAAAAFPLYTAVMHQQARAWHDVYWALHQHEDRIDGIAGVYSALYTAFDALVTYRLPDDYWDDLPHALAALGDDLAHRAHLVEIYDAVLRDLPVERPPLPAFAPLWRYPLRVPAHRRDDTLDALWAAQIDATCWYPSLRLMAAALAPGIRQPPTPHADAYAARVLTLPVDPRTSAADAQQCAGILADVLSAR